MHRMLEASSRPVAQHVRLRFPPVRPIRLEGDPDRGSLAAERSLAVRAAPTSGAVGDPIAWRGRNAPPSTRAHRLRRPRRSAEGRRPVRQDEGLNPTGTFKARGMAVAVPMACALGATTLAVPTAGNAGAALAA